MEGGTRGGDSRYDAGPFLIHAVSAQSWGHKTPDCAECRAKPHKRKQWGCDEPSTRPVFHAACECHGTSPACRRCNGKGRVAYHRCPAMLIAGVHPDSVRESYFALTAYAQYQRNGTLPCTGGWLDQPEWFEDYVLAFDRQRAHWERVMHEDMEKEAARANAKR